ncbi:conserved hypothetical protein [Gammaproteobacteria bacterium]
MKHLLISILIFIVTNCFAISQKVVDGLKEYEIAVEKLEKAANELKSNDMLEDWELSNLVRGNILCTDGIAECSADYIDETKYGTTVVNYNEAKKLVNKLKPKRDEYNRQKEREERIKNTIHSIIVVSAIIAIFLSFFGFIIWLAITQHKKYQKLLKEGKITQAEYDSIISSSHEEYTPFRGDRTNPATGLRMTGGYDSGGNLYGCSSRYSSSENYRTKWD